jgi:aminoglycoside phosphotransferase (APT) family kinase protein
MPAKPIDESELQVRAERAVAGAESGAQLGPIQPLQGGTSSITYRATITVPEGAPRDVVLKVAPAGLAPTKNRDVLRQARLQRALTGTGVPVPAVVADDGGDPPEIPPFYVMSFEAGDCVEPSGLSGDKRLPAAEVRDRMLDAARILEVLHSVDPESVRLVAGEDTVSPGAELDRWVQSLQACDEDLRVGGDVRERLVAEVPDAAQSALIHGDFRLGNTMSTGDHVVAVIDWEIWSLGDPRVDLAWFLMACNPDERLNRPVAAGAPGNAELIDTYQQARGAEVRDLAWFEALVRYKQLAVTALLIRNARRRGQANTMGASLNPLQDSARHLLGLG